MNIGLAKTLRRGDRLRVIRPQPKCSHARVSHVFSDGVGIICECGDKSILKFDTKFLWSRIELVDLQSVHAKQTAIINQLRNAKVGDEVAHSNICTDRPGTIVALDEHSVTFKWYLARPETSRWEFDIDLCWECLTLVSGSVAPMPNSVMLSVYDKVCADRDILHAEVIRDYRTRLEEANRATQAWQDSAAQNSRNTQYYRDLLLQIAEVLGPEKFVDDTGGVHPDVLVAKVPELARAAILAGPVAAVKAKIVPAPKPLQPYVTSRTV